MRRINRCVSLGDLFVYAFHKTVKYGVDLRQAFAWSPYANRHPVCAYVRLEGISGTQDPPLSLVISPLL